MSTARPFLPETLRQYAVLADGERGAVIGPRGEVAFLCAPRWHDDGLFSALVGGDGHYTVTPAEDRFVWGGSYEPGTLIWRSRWVATEAVLESREALAFPGDPDRLVLLRRLEPLSGTTPVRVVLHPRAGFGQHRLRLDGRSGPAWVGTCGDLHVRWRGVEARPDETGSRLEAELTVRPGEHVDLVLEVSARPFSDAPVDPAEAWRRTEQAWADAVPEMTGSLAPGDSRHSYAVLRGLTSSDGGMVAAVTMSLPERAQQRRNYDYRYAWLRDQCFAGVAAAAVGGTDLLDSAVSFVAERLLADGPDVRPAYTVAGDPIPGERRLDLPGYPGGGHVLAGNRVNEQFQLDVLGEALLLFAAAAEQDRLSPDHWKAAEVAVDAIRRRGDQPDAGIWELEDRYWTHSRLMCAAGLRAAARCRRGRGDAWVDLADQIVARADRESRHPSGRWQRAPDDPRLDAALLLPAIRGAVPYDDPRSVATWQAVGEELSDDGYVYRFRQDRDRRLHEAEGAFLLCGFHMALASHQQGDHALALRWFERNRAAVGSPGLFAEEFDVVQRQLRGNLPQAFVHALLLEAAHTLAAPGSAHPGFDRNRR